jgi:hypothetical protein
MREIRPYGSEGGEPGICRVFLPLSSERTECIADAARRDGAVGKTRTNNAGGSG